MPSIINHFKTQYSRRSIAFFLISAIFLATFIAFLHSDDFFRGYTDERQSSLGSADMHNLAWASFHNKGVIDGLFLAKRISDNGTATDYAHYTNGYPILVGIYYRLVGDTLITSRLFPILSISVGGFLFLLTMVTREKISPVIFLAIPFLLASSIGRDAATFELLEPAHFLVLGITSFLIYRNNPRLIKITAILIGISLYQVSFIFIGAIIIAWYLKSKNHKELIALFTFLIFCMSVVLIVFASSSGWDELFKIIQKRSGLNIEGYGSDESINLKGYINSLLDIRLNQSINYVIFAGAMLESFFQARSGKYLLPCILASLLVYSVTFLNHTGAHYFTYLIYVYLILVAWIAFLSRLSIFVSQFSNNRFAAIILMLLLIGTYLMLTPKERNYKEDSATKADYYALKKWEASNDPSQCSTFNIVGIRTDSRIVSPFFAKYFGRTAHGHPCYIDLSN